MNAPLPSNTPIDLTAPLTLWRVAAAFMHLLHALFGAPEDVAARSTLRFAAYKLMISWLRAGEAMMRRLLLIEAAAYAKPNTRPLLRAARKRKRKLMSFTADAPEKWRVSFRCFQSPMLRQAQHDVEGVAAGSVSVSLSLSKAKRPGRLSREDRFKPVQFRSAWPLAERYEALLRVFNNPLRYARRLARKLHATPHRAYELLRREPEAEHRIDRFEEMTITATTRAVILNTT